MKTQAKKGYLLQHRWSQKNLLKSRANTPEEDFLKFCSFCFHEYTQLKESLAVFFTIEKDPITKSRHLSECFCFYEWWWRRWWWWWSNGRMGVLRLSCWDDELFFYGMVERRKPLSLISSRDHCQRSSPSRISDTPPAGFEPM